MSIYYNTVITQEGLRASIENCRDRNGFSIRLNSIEVVSGSRVVGRFPCTGILRGSNSITVNALVTGTETYDITQINLIDGISGKVFANVKRKDDAVIDTVNNGKTTVLLFTVGFIGVPKNTVTIKVNQGNNLVDSHNNDELAHYEKIGDMLNLDDVVYADSSQTRADSNKIASAQTGFDFQKNHKKYEDDVKKIEQTTSSDGSYNDISQTIHKDTIIMPNGMCHQILEIRNVNMLDRAIVKHLWGHVSSMTINLPRPMSNILDVQVNMTMEHDNNFHLSNNVASAFLCSWDVSEQVKIGGGVVKILFSQIRNVNASLPVNIRVCVKGVLA